MKKPRGDSIRCKESRKLNKNNQNIPVMGENLFRLASKLVGYLINHHHC